jgi:hypothetical protein
MKKETCLKVITLLLFTVSPLFAQENIQLSGSVFAPNLDGASVHIINSTQIYEIFLVTLVFILFL